MMLKINKTCQQRAAMKEMDFLRQGRKEFSKTRSGRLRGDTRTGLCICVCVTDAYDVDIMARAQSQLLSRVTCSY